MKDPVRVAITGASTMSLIDMAWYEGEFIPSVQQRGGDWQILDGIAVNDFSRARMRATEAELVEERDAVAHLLP